MREFMLAMTDWNHLCHSPWDHSIARFVAGVGRQRGAVSCRDPFAKGENQPSLSVIVCRVVCVATVGFGHFLCCAAKRTGCCRQ